MEGLIRKLLARPNIASPSRRLAVVAVLLLMGLPQPVRADAMPPFSEGFRARARDFYKIVWLPDGYPGRRNADGSITAHPLYGIYALTDYLAQVDAAPDGPNADHLRWAINRVATAARNRMRTFKDAIVFWYTPAEFPSSFFPPGRFYSGLTMSYWANTFHHVYEVTGLTAAKAWARRSFNSVRIPDTEGGVLERTQHGIAIAEYPTKPRYMALNGWLSATVSIYRYGTRAGVPEAVDLARASANTIAKMLPLYDAPQVRNSRYGLAGSQTARVVFSSQPKLVRTVMFSTPSEGRYSLAPRKGRLSSFWVFPADVIDRTRGFTPRQTSFRANLFISRIAYPKRSSMQMVIDVTRRTRVDVQLSVGRYDPRKAGPQGRRWVSIHRQTIQPGRTSVNAIIPWSTQHTVAYPTTFVKVLERRNTNVYHLIHINRLRTLRSLTGNATFTYWADRWRGFVCQWPALDLYDGLYVSHGGTITPQEYCDSTAA